MVANGLPAFEASAPESTWPALGLSTVSPPDESAQGETTSTDRDGRATARRSPTGSGSPEPGAAPALDARCLSTGGITTASSHHRTGHHHLHRESPTQPAAGPPASFEVTTLSTFALRFRRRWTVLDCPEWRRWPNSTRAHGIRHRCGNRLLRRNAKGARSFESVPATAVVRRVPEAGPGHSVSNGVASVTIGSGRPTEASASRCEPHRMTRITYSLISRPSGATQTP